MIPFLGLSLVSVCLWFLVTQKYSHNTRKLSYETDHQDLPNLLKKKTALALQLHLKRDLGTGVFLWVLRNF